ncbi:4457_t:CDS:2 [Cetraspora pellucida]|uniref:4457_t:CDS:1 n=1 Tax=Cetraspora pellucida TaxID=1433469 RepID=A0A9N8VZJ0_9GLOM|nr:4457_t:CDS:2 [Cetraspora pellucida]
MEMEISPFVLNQTRLIVMSDQKVVVAFIKLKEENLIVDGDEYKKHSWQYGRKYVFFKNKSRLKVHRYKYTFELEPVTTDQEESVSFHVGKNKSVQQQKDDESNLPQITEVFSDSVNTSFLSEGDVVG